MKTKIQLFLGLLLAFSFVLSSCMPEKERVIRTKEKLGGYNYLLKTNVSPVEFAMQEFGLNDEIAATLVVHKIIYLENITPIIGEYKKEINCISSKIYVNKADCKMVGKVERKALKEERDTLKSERKELKRKLKAVEKDYDDNVLFLAELIGL